MKINLLLLGISMFFSTILLAAGVERVEVFSGSVEKVEQEVLSDSESEKEGLQRYLFQNPYSFPDSTRMSRRMERVLRVSGFGAIGAELVLMTAMFLFPLKRFVFVLLSLGFVILWWIAFFHFSKKGDRKQWIPFMIGTVILFFATFGIYLFFIVPRLSFGTAENIILYIEYALYLMVIILLGLSLNLIFSFISFSFVKLKEKSYHKRKKLKGNYERENYE